MSEVQLCQAFRGIADDLVGHDLSPEETARWTAHARQCSRCGAQWRQALSRSAALSTLTPWALEAAGVKPPAPGTTADAVFARLAAGEGIPNWSHRWARPFAAAAAVVVMAGGALLTKPLWLGAPKEQRPGIESAGPSLADVNRERESVADADPESGMLGAEESRRVLLQSPFDEEGLRRRAFSQFISSQNVPMPGGSGAGGYATNYVDFGGSTPVNPAPPKQQRF